jgi:sugar phosphate isomerase/epimerase
VLSSASVYPESVSTTFELAGELGFDGIELMVSVDAVSSDIDAVARLCDYHGIPVMSVHAPCLLITQRVWGTDPTYKLERSVDAARRLGAGVVVVHPPFRWQGSYADDFAALVRRLDESSEVTVAVENMYPWRTPGGELAAYAPAWDPTDHPFDHLTLDLSHASTARQQSLTLAQAWGERLRHVHLTDGSGSVKDEHLLPGEGDQRAAEVLAGLVREDWRGAVVLEVNTSRFDTRDAREQALAASLAFTRTHLASASLVVP